MRVITVRPNNTNNMVATVQTPEWQEQQLQKIYKSLNLAEKRLLSEFAEFLYDKHVKNKHQGKAELLGGLVAPDDTLASVKPLEINRPENESVIKAIKRLSWTYPMIDKSQMLTATSTLMTQHIMKGREAKAIIDELEELFKLEYEKLHTN